MAQRDNGIDVRVGEGSKKDPFEDWDKLTVHEIVSTNEFLMVPQENGRNKVGLLWKYDDDYYYAIYETGLIGRVKRGRGEDKYAVTGFDSKKAFIRRVRDYRA